ncbi:MAG: LysM domain-containing protein [Opitutales bacterium]
MTLFILPSLAFSQNRGNSVADLTQDIALMRREVGQLRLEVEQLRRENEALKYRQSGTVSGDVVSAQNNVLKTEFDAKLQALKSDIIVLVKKDLDNMAAQTNTALQKVVSSIESRPSATLTTSFSGDFPKTGVNYTVQRGDNLSKIASMFNSKIKWIQDANTIANPTAIQVGQELFIPQK